LLQRQGTAVNVVALAGHGKIRSAVMGFDARPATVDEVKAMSRLLEASLDEGAGGFSTGLIYEPGRHALPEEVEALVAVAGAHDGIYATHMRSEADQLLEAMDECIGAARKSGTALQISHLKTSGPQNWHKAEAAIRKIEDARQAGMRVYADRYPYTASGTTLTVVLPGWAREGGTVALAKRLADSAIRARMLREVQELRDEEYWSTVAIGATFHEETHLLRGRTLRAVGELWGCSPAEALLRVLELDEARTYAFYFSMCEENLHRFLEQPWLMICSDASCGAPTGPLSKGHPHPRSYGSHARALAMGRAGKPLALPEMVRRMTSLPAEAFGLKGRGRVAVGQCADIAVFDAERVCDRATYAQPHQLAEGMHHVIVNGVAVLEGGFITGRLPGHFLKPELG
jgi:N-acyl-D-amino-acid deacylase